MRGPRVIPNYKRQFELALHLFHELEAEDHRSIRDLKLLFDIIHTTISQYEAQEVREAESEVDSNA